MDLLLVALTTLRASEQGVVARACSPRVASPGHEYLFDPHVTWGLRVGCAGRSDGGRAP